MSIVELLEDRCLFMLHAVISERIGERYASAIKPHD